MFSIFQASRQDIRVLGERQTHPLLGLANNCLVGDGTAVPVDEAEEESSPS